jgi:hypothetical protein
MFIGVNEIGHDAAGGWVGSGNGAPAGPAMQGSLAGGETAPPGPTKMFVAPMSADISAGSSRKTGLRAREPLTMAVFEVKEKKDRVDDALNATRAAVEEGITSILPNFAFHRVVQG